MTGNPIVELAIRLDSREMTIVGRDAWALGQLIEAGDRGCTPIEQPAPRWSHHVYKLRKAGIVVETITENHAGAYAGHMPATCCAARWR
jgi:hypothetical protein